MTEQTYDQSAAVNHPDAFSEASVPVLPGFATPGEAISALSSIVGLTPTAAAAAASGPAARRFAANYSLAPVERLLSLVRSDALAAPAGYMSSVWNQATRQREMNLRESPVIIAPAGRARIDPFPLNWYNWDHMNTKAGSSQTRYMAALEAEQTSYDSGYDKMMKRDLARLRPWVATRLSGPESHFLSWAYEGISASLVSQAMWKNYSRAEDRAATDATALSTQGARSGEQWSFTAECRRYSYPGGSNARIRFVPYTRIRQHEASLEPAGRVWVCRARTHSELFGEIAAIWAGSREEFSVVSGNVDVYCAHLSDDDLGDAFQTIGLRFRTSYEDPSRLWNRILRQKPHGWSLASILVSGADNARLLEVSALHRGWVTGDGKYARITDLGPDAPPHSINIPWSHHLVRLGSAFDIVNFVGDALEEPWSWRNLVVPSHYRATLIGAYTDAASQAVLGHWRNSLMVADASAILARWRFFVLLLTSPCYTRSKTWQLTGVYNDLPGAVGERDVPTIDRSLYANGSVGFDGSTTVHPGDALDEDYSLLAAAHAALASGADLEEVASTLESHSMPSPGSTHVGPGHAPSPRIAPPSIHPVPMAGFLVHARVDWIAAWSPQLPSFRASVPVEVTTPKTTPLRPQEALMLDVNAEALGYLFTVGVARSADATLHLRLVVGADAHVVPVIRVGSTATDLVVDAPYEWLRAQAQFIMGSAPLQIFKYLGMFTVPEAALASQMGLVPAGSLEYF
uniref:Coat protein n=2 Tax=unclassified Totivirus TaxID=348097 RepID=A0A977R5K3_9VIRU|nr:coat protein [Conidiobolus heterosporus totivirus 3]UXL82817.1 coat protein [Conidiobolus chlamydosporus totivirus 1]